MDAEWENGDNAAFVCIKTLLSNMNIITSRAE